MAQLPIHFFTIVLNGVPFIRYHLAQMRSLTCQWHWHIIEGVADLNHDTAWSLRHGAVVPQNADRGGRSVDGTSEYLDQIANDEPDRIIVYRAPGGRNWDGKREMISAPLANLNEQCLLWQIDSDELWTTEQMTHLREIFLADPDRNAAIFYCHFFVGPDLAIDRTRRYPEIEWRRVWRYTPGMKWLAHEPPVLASSVASKPGKFVDVATIKPFWPSETAAEGLIFQKFEYATEAQLAFKEKYSGYTGIREQWQALNARTEFPVALRDYFDWPWVDPGAMVDRVAKTGIKPLAQTRPAQTPGTVDWEFEFERRLETTDPQPLRPTRGVLYVTWGEASKALLKRSMESLKAVHPEMAVHVQELPDNSTLLDKASMLDFAPFDETLFLDTDTVVLDRLDFGFAMARKHGLACAICENPWARRYAGLGGDLPEYNTGVLFFTRVAKPVFDFWASHARLINSSCRHVQGAKMEELPINDQASFSLAVADWDRSPFVLANNWNFRPDWHRSWWGPIKIWHHYQPVPPAIVKWTREQSKPGAIIQYAQLPASK